MLTSVFTAVTTFLIGDTALILGDPEVNVDPEATSDTDPADDPDEIVVNVAPWTDVTEDPVFVELEGPALKEDDELRVGPTFRELEDPIVMADGPSLERLEDPELKLEEPDVKLDPNAAPWLDVDEEDPELKDNTGVEVPVLALLDVPVMNEMEDPRLSVLVMPEWKHPAHKGPVPVKVTVDPILAELVFPPSTTTVSIFVTFSTDEVSISFSTTFMAGISSTDDISISFWITCVAGKKVLSNVLSGGP